MANYGSENCLRSMIEFGVIAKSVEILPKIQNILSIENIIQMLSILIDFDNSAKFPLVSINFVSIIFQVCTKNNLPESFFVNLLWLLNYLCKGPNFPSYSIMKYFMKLIPNLLLTENQIISNFIKFNKI